MKTKLTALALVFFMAIAVFIPANTTATETNQSGNPLKSIPIAGTGEGGGSFTGTLTIERFVEQGGQILAIGRLNGTVQGGPGGTKEVKNHPVRLPVSASSPTTTSSNQSASQQCPILHLELGPIDLNLLGLKVHLNKVVLDITAQSGGGNLLGNLLCDIANLLNGGGALSQIVGLLNQILSALG